MVLHHQSTLGCSFNRCGAGVGYYAVPPLPNSTGNTQASTSLGPELVDPLPGKHARDRQMRKLFVNPPYFTLLPELSCIARVVAGKWAEELWRALVAQQPPESVVLSPLQRHISQFHVVLNSSFPLRCRMSSFLPSWARSKW